MWTLTRPSIWFQTLLRAECMHICARTQMFKGTAQLWSRACFVALSCCHDLRLTREWQWCYAQERQPKHCPFTPSKPKAHLLLAQHLCLLLLTHTSLVRYPALPYSSLSTCFTLMPGFHLSQQRGIICLGEKRAVQDAPRREHLEANSLCGGRGVQIKSTSFLLLFSL